MVHDERQGVGQGLQQVTSHVHTDQGGAAAHARQVVGEDIMPHAKLVDQHGSHAGRRCKAAAGHHDHHYLHSNSQCSEVAQLSAAIGPGDFLSRDVNGQGAVAVQGLKVADAE